MIVIAFQSSPILNLPRDRVRDFTITIVIVFRRPRSKRWTGRYVTANGFDSPIHPEPLLHKGERERTICARHPRKNQIDDGPVFSAAAVPQSPSGVPSFSHAYGTQS